MLERKVGRPELKTAITGLQAQCTNHTAAPTKLGEEKNEKFVDTNIGAALEISHIK